MRRITIAVAVFALVLAAPAAAQQAHVSLYQDINDNSCTFTIQPPSQLRTAYIYVGNNSFDFTELRFNVTPPGCSGFIFVQLIPDGLHIATGDLVNGFTLSGPCAGARVMGAITYLTGPTPGSCCMWEIEPWPSSARGEIEVVACDNFVGFAEAHPASLNGYCLCDIADFAQGPYRPTPADGATSVPLNAQLSWEGGCCPDMWVMLSDQPFTGFPSENIIYDGPRQNPFDPGALAPNTTYYWRVSEYWTGISPHGFEGDSRIWSFTTGDIILPAERVTWGGIKALYR